MIVELVYFFVSSDVSRRTLTHMYPPSQLPHRSDQSLDAAAVRPTDDVAHVVKGRYIEVSRLSNGRVDSASLAKSG
jgi:hypothetical protein